MNCVIAGVLLAFLVPGPTAQCLTVDSASGPAPGQWTSYNNGYPGQRFSPLDQINADNVSSLREVCRLKVADGGSFHTGPLVVGRDLYLTTVLDTFAVNPTNCNVKWKSSYELEEAQVWASNRGVAFMNGRIFRGTTDGRLLAMDAKTGEVLWKNVVGDPARNEFVPSVPIAWNGLVITGTSGSDLGIKGRIMAFDAATGREVWRFTTIPTGTEIGADSWTSRRTAETGGAGTWSTFALDVVAGEVFVPTGNPAPSFAPEYRPGRNLFTDSLVVLDARTGALKWWYQLDANDGHDLDLAAPPMLYTNRAGHDVVAVSGKDGYVHAVDRASHRLLFKTAVTTIENEGVRPSKTETTFCPGGLGGNEWNGPALDPRSATLFNGSVDWCTKVTSSGETRFVKGQGNFLMGATFAQVLDPVPSGWISALDADTGTIKWKVHADSPIVAGVTPTAGGIVMTGDMAGNFLALDSKTGHVLLKKQTGGAMAGGVITYAIDGRQYVAFASGNVSRSTFGVSGTPTLVIMALDEGDAGRSSVASAISAATASAVPKVSVPDPKRGQPLYAAICAGCHGALGTGGTAPSIQGLNRRLNLAETIAWIKSPAPPMPQLYPVPIGEQEVQDIAAYIQQF
jgi:alcohol dehydrogenase (cytochrome c)